MGSAFHRPPDDSRSAEARASVELLPPAQIAEVGAMQGSTLSIRLVLATIETAERLGIERARFLQLA